MTGDAEVTARKVSPAPQVRWTQTLKFGQILEQRAPIRFNFNK